MDKLIIKGIFAMLCLSLCFGLTFAWTSPSSVISKSGETQPATNSIDGDTGTYWSFSSYTFPTQWIIYDTGSTQTISQLRLQIGDPDGSVSAPCSLSAIYVCDDNACSGESSLGTCGTWTGAAGTRDCDIADTSGRYIKLKLNTHTFGSCGASYPVDLFYEFWYDTASVATTTFTVTPNSPATNTYTNDSTPDTNCTVAGTNSSYSCDLMVGTTKYGLSGVVNNTATVKTANATLSNANQSWYWNCTNGTVSNQSAVRYLVIDTISPNATISQPATNGVMNNSAWIINLSVTETNLNATLGTNCTVKNSTGSIINSTMNASTGSIKCYLSVYVNGTFNITATTTDKAGNVNSTTNSNISQTIYGAASNPCTVPTGTNWYINQDCSIYNTTITNSTVNLIINGTYKYLLYNSTLTIHSRAWAVGATFGRDQYSRLNLVP